MVFDFTGSLGFFNLGNNAKKSPINMAVCCIWLLLFSGCSLHKPGAQFAQPQVYTSSDFAELSTQNLSESDRNLYQNLQRQYSKWAGTPYEFGGHNRQGIDCSALMVEVFKGAFKQSLPRTTAQQVKVGERVSATQMKVGDLVFFKTGYDQRHVGVFMGASQFLHASVSNGVTFGRLDDPYWRSRYWQSRRIL